MYIIHPHSMKHDYIREGKLQWIQ